MAASFAGDLTLLVLRRRPRHSIRLAFTSLPAPFPAQFRLERRQR